MKVNPDLEILYEEHAEYLSRLRTTFDRFYVDEVDWEERLVFLLGARGVGKTTIILQYIKEKFGENRKALYVSMDNMTMGNISLLTIADYHYHSGGTHLFIDEVHKYDNWSLELKNIYDKYPDIHTVVSGSSILEINKGNADLSRRAVSHVVPGLSLREFINIETGSELPSFTLEELVTDHVSIAVDIVDVIKPTTYFKEYLEYGFYPFYLQGKRSYTKKLNNIVNLIMEVDMPSMLNTDIRNASKLRKLIYLLSTEVPFTPNLSKLSASLELNRNTLTNYLHYLDKASILNLVWKEGKSYSLLSKPDKVLMHNPNLFYMSTRTPNVGSLRETFFKSVLDYEHEITLSKKGDFLVDKKYTFEVGGRNKDLTQIWDVPDSYLAVDDTLIGTERRIPLWMFGFLY